MFCNNWNQTAGELSSVAHENSRQDTSYYAYAPKSQCMAFLPSTLSRRHFQHQLRVAKVHIRST